MRNRPTFVLLALLLGTLPAAAFPAMHLAHAQADSTAMRRHTDSVAVRAPASEALDAYRSDPAFQYERDRSGEAWWQRLRRWIWETIFGPAEGALGAWSRPLMYGLLGAALLFAFVQFARMRAGGGFEPPARPMTANFREIEENLRTVDLGALTDDAVQAGDLRRAVRLLYLHALRALADAGRIDWNPAKTNRAYLREVAASGPSPQPDEAARGASLADELDTLIRYFERVWYGHADVTEAAFERLRTRFDRFRRRVERESTGERAHERARESDARISA